jgi:hypothetical protein
MAIRTILVSLCAFILVEAAIFRSGWYNQFLEPVSSAGIVESALYFLRHQKPPDGPQSLIVGDSRIAEGFSAKLANQAAGGRMHFWNFGIPGSTPRDWYYILRDADPDRHRFAAIALALDHYSDADSYDNLETRESDLNYLIGRLRVTDCVPFSRSMNNPKIELRIWAGCMFKGIALRRDVQDLLSHRESRVERARDWLKNGFGYVFDYGGKPEDLRGLGADFVHRTIEFPPGITDNQKETIRATLLPDPAPQTGALTRYRRRWLGGILERYRNSGTRIILFEMPRAPLSRPDFTEPARFLESVRGQANVSVLPKQTFRDLERPEWFADGLHLNHVGRGIFSARVAAVLDRR